MDAKTRTDCGSAACGSLFDEPMLGSGRASTDSVFYIEKMDCPSEERQIRQKLGALRGIHRLQFDLENRRLTVTHHLEQTSTIKAALTELGMPPSGAHGGRTDVFHVPNMDCKNEVAQIRERLETLQGIDDLRFDLKQRVLSVDHRLDGTEPITAALETLGMPAAQAKPAAAQSAQRSTFHIPNMDCRNEERQVREQLQGMAGIEDLEFDLPQRRLTIIHRLPDPAPVLQALTEIGMPAKLALPVPHSAEAAVLARVDTFRIEKMDCPTEEGLIRKRLASVPGIEELDFNLMQRKLTVRHTLPATAPIVAALKDVGMPPAELPAAATGTAQRTVFRIENMDCPTE